MVDKWRGREQVYISAFVHKHPLTLDPLTAGRWASSMRAQRPLRADGEEHQVYANIMWTWFPFGVQSVLSRHHQRPVGNKTTHQQVQGCSLLTADVLRHVDVGNLTHQWGNRLGLDHRAESSVHVCVLKNLNTNLTVLLLWPCIGVDLCINNVVSVITHQWCRRVRFE